MEPVRTCLGCRQRDTRSSLVRLVVRNGDVVVDAGASLPGRGAWVHPRIDCIESSLKRRAFGRALGFDGAVDAEALRTTLDTSRGGPTPPPDEQADSELMSNN